MKFEKERKNIAFFMRRLYEQKLTTTSGGNVSQRIDNIVLITASQTDKAIMDEDQIGIISIGGNNLSDLKISMESKMHLAIYHNRLDVQAIVHSHPIFATSFAISGKDIKTNLAGEARAVLGKPVVASYALMGTQDLANTVAEASLKGNVILMENHGILTLGENLLQAYDRMEVLEAAAKMTFITSFMGGRKELTEEELKAIDKLFE
jgi:L-fuculose-phosphate aldolase